MVAESQGDTRESEARNVVRSRAGRFIAVDGESITLPDGEHRYVLLSAVCWNGDKHVLRKPAGLSTEECFNFLLNLSQSYRGILVGFAWQYDLNMQMRDIYRADVANIAMRDSCYYRGKSADYVVRNMAGKITKIYRGSIAGKGFKTHGRVTIYDVFGFFQCSFVKALKTWEITQDTEFIEEMKGARSSFSEADLDRMEAYNLEECRLLVKLVQKVCLAFSNSGYVLESYHGAGAAGSAILKKHGIKNHIEEPPDELRGPILQAYYGGRIQMVQQGLFENRVYQYDINSAYPAAMRELPSLTGGTWRPTDRFIPGVIGLYRAQWHIQPKSPVSPFPFRRKGVVHFPTAGIGWYWHHEIEAATEFIRGEMLVDQGYIFTPAEPHATPFAFIDADYQRRRAYKEKGQAEHIALKLALNSMYGKNAQSMGGQHGRPPYQSYMWAGITTSYARSAMYRLAMQAPDEVITIATDGILTTQPLAVREGSDLGGYEATSYDNAFVFGAGRYLLNNDNGRAVVKTRGFEGRELDWGRLLEAWLQHGIYAEIPVHMTRFVGYKSARHLKRWDAWRTWLPMLKVIRAGQFRRGIPRDFHRYDAHEPPLIVRWDTFAFSHGEESEPYKPKVTPEDIEKMMGAEQPL